MLVIYDLVDVLMSFLAPKEKRSNKQKKDNLRDYENKAEKKKKLPVEVVNWKVRDTVEEYEASIG